jgi:citrate lyase subunit beta / citryl-CoA lyase
MTVAHDLAGASTFLFVPGHRPDRFAKATASGADEIVLDLEDAVAPDLKAVAREHVRRWLAAGGAGIVRINAAGTPWHADDLAVLAEHPGTVMLPKVEDPTDVTGVLEGLPAEACVIPILESARGILHAPSICEVAGLTRVAFGNGDLATQLGVEHTDRDALTYARSAVVLASAAAGVAPPIDGVTTSVADEKCLVEDTRHAARLGFTAKLCIHPRQIPVVRAALLPTPEQLARARHIVAAASDSVTTVDGEMVDKPIVDRARMILARAAVSANE